MITITLPEKYHFIPRFYRLAIVNVLSNLMIPLAGLISVAFLGHLENIDALVGVAIASVLFNLVYMIFEFLRMGTTGLTAQAVGADDQSAAILVGLRNGLIALGLGIFLLILQYPLQQFGFWVLSADTDIKAAGIEYFNARIWGAPGVLLNFVLIGWLLGQEENRKVLTLSIIGNAANILLDYIFIIEWDWSSTGAGVSQVCSQYLMLFMGIIFASQKLQWQELQLVAPKIMDLSSLKISLALNRDILIRTISEMSIFTIFAHLSTSMGKIVFAQNSLLGQILQLNIYLNNGLGFATETLSGNFKGKKSKEELIPLLRFSVISSLLIGLSIGGLCVCFPQVIFGILTNHREITETINIYVWLLSIILALYSVSAMLEGYFLGLAEGKIIRNVTLISAVFGFIPLAIASWYFHNNYILWMSSILFRCVKIIGLLMYLPKSLIGDSEVDTVSLLPIKN